MVLWPMILAFRPRCHPLTTPACRKWWRLIDRKSVSGVNIGLQEVTVTNVRWTFDEDIGMVLKKILKTCCQRLRQMVVLYGCEEENAEVFRYLGTNGVYRI